MIFIAFSPGFAVSILLPVELSNVLHCYCLEGGISGISLGFLVNQGLNLELSVISILRSPLAVDDSGPWFYECLDFL